MDYFQAHGGSSGILRSPMSHNLPQGSYMAPQMIPDPRHGYEMSYGEESFQMDQPYFAQGQDFVQTPLSGLQTYGYELQHGLNPEMRTITYSTYPSKWIPSSTKHIYFCPQG